MSDATYRAVADPTRRAILDALADGERSAGELVALFDVSQPAISQHLAVLRDAELVVVRQEGRHRIYALNADPLREVHDWAGHYERFWSAKLDVLAQVLARQAAADLETTRHTKTKMTAKTKKTAKTKMTKRRRS